MMHGVRPAVLDVAEDLRHLVRLSDALGLLEHADHDRPRPEHGYCVDDNARAVILADRERDRSDTADGLFARCLAFVLDAQAPDGRFHNRRSVDGRWTDAPDTGDHWGRALWALGVVAARTAGEVTARVRAGFLRGARHRSPHPRAMAYAALGAAELLGGAPSAREAVVAREVLIDAVATIGSGGDPGWPWPAPRLTYANARLPEALIAAGVALRDAGALADGLALLRWLVVTETSAGVASGTTGGTSGRQAGHLSFTPTGGWGRGEPRPAFDQQPIEAWALADAAGRALHATCDPYWSEVVGRCSAWFEGANDAGVPLRDAVTGGGCDGLTVNGRNENQGAESTLAMIATMQRARDAGVASLPV
jgi:hypothetical protein